MTETIGKITLDYKHYPGEDLYCDGLVEDELLDIVKNYPVSEFGRIIEEKASWPVLYHLSPLRGNIVEWVPLDKNMKVLEIGAGCGAITGTLSQKAGEVTCIDLSKKRSHINAWRNKDCENVTIQVGNFQDIEPELSCDYDYIFLIGVFEYGQGYIGTDNPYEEFLHIIKKHIKPDGNIVIAIENKFGLKYFAGCKEDHLGSYFSSIEDYPTGGGVRTFTRNGLEKICKAVGVEDYSFYYPYPDYKFMTSLYSDAYLPKTGELCDNMRNFDRDRMLLFDEKNAFDSIIREGLFSLYANSYVLLIGKAPEIKYVKYSNDRAEKFAIRTAITQKQNGTRQVYKTAVTESAKEHINHIQEAYEKLTERYKGSPLCINHCRQSGQGVELAYLEGKTLEEVLDGHLDRQDMEGFFTLIAEYRQAVGYGQESLVTDYDLIFSNIMIGTDATWTILDYEWTFEQEVSPEEITARSLYCYMLGAWKRREASLSYLRDKLGYSESDIIKLGEKEAKFQRFVTGQRLSMVEIRNKINCSILPVQEIAVSWEAKWSKKKVQIYEDIGEGFTEEKSYFVNNVYEEKYKEVNKIKIQLFLGGEVQKVRIDPALEPCMVTIQKLEVNGRQIQIDGKSNLSNGNLISENTIVFATADPNLTLDLKEWRDSKKEIFAKLEIVSLSESMAEQAAKGFGKKRLFW